MTSSSPWSTRGFTIPGGASTFARCSAAVANDGLYLFFNYVGQNSDSRGASNLVAVRNPDPTGAPLWSNAVRLQLIDGTAVKASNGPNQTFSPLISTSSAGIAATAWGDDTFLVACPQAFANDPTAVGLFLGVYNVADVQFAAKTWKARWSAMIPASKIASFASQAGAPVTDRLADQHRLVHGGPRDGRPANSLPNGLVLPSGYGGGRLTFFEYAGPVFFLAPMDPTTGFPSENSMCFAAPFMDGKAMRPTTGRWPPPSSPATRRGGTGRTPPVDGKGLAAWTFGTSVVEELAVSYGRRDFPLEYNFAYCPRSRRSTHGQGRRPSRPSRLGRLLQEQHGDRQPARGGDDTDVDRLLRGPLLRRQRPLPGLLLRDDHRPACRGQLRDAAHIAKNIIAGIIDGPIPIPNENTTNATFPPGEAVLGQVTYGITSSTTRSHIDEASDLVGRVHGPGRVHPGRRPRLGHLVRERHGHRRERLCLLEHERQPGSWRPTPYYSQQVLPVGTLRCTDIVNQMTLFKFTDAAGNVVVNPTTSANPVVPSASKVAILDPVYTGETLVSYSPSPSRPGTCCPTRRRCGIR